MILEGTRRKILPDVKRRLNDEERKQICAGAVYVWNESECGMKRWTDGRIWLASKVKSPFLTYQEFDETRKVKKNGLTKQIFSLTTKQNAKLHLIAYYNPTERLKGHFDDATPSKDPILKTLSLDPEIYLNDVLGCSSLLNRDESNTEMIETGRRASEESFLPGFQEQNTWPSSCQTFPIKLSTFEYFHQPKFCSETANSNPRLGVIDPPLVKPIPTMSWKDISASPAPLRGQLLSSVSSHRTFSDNMSSDLLRAINTSSGPEIKAFGQSPSLKLTSLENGLLLGLKRAKLSTNKIPQPRADDSVRYTRDDRLKLSALDKTFMV